MLRRNIDQEQQISWTGQYANKYSVPKTLYNINNHCMCIYEYVYVYIYTYILIIPRTSLSSIFKFEHPQLDVFSKQRSSWVAGLIIPPIKSILQEFGFNYSKFTFDHPEHQDHKMAFLSFSSLDCYLKRHNPKQNDKKLRRYAKITTSPSPSQEIPRNGFLS